MKKISYIFLTLFVFPTLLLFIPNITKAEEKPTLIIADFDIIGDATNEDHMFVVESLRSAIVQTKKYKVLDRTEMETIIEEAKFQRSEMCEDDMSDSCYIEIGGALGAAYLVKGKIIKSKKLLQVTLKLLNMKTTETVNSVTKRCSPCEMIDLLPQVEQGALELLGEDSSRGIVKVIKDGRKKSDKKLSMEKSSKTFLFVKSNVPGASIFVDGKMVGTTPHTLENISIGMHEVRLEKKDYYPIKRKLNLKPGGLKVQLDLVPHWGSLKIITTPSGASVTLNGQPAGKTPLEIDRLESKKYEVYLELKHYLPKKLNFDIIDGKKTKITEHLTANFGSLTITSEPDGADIYVDGEKLGRTPISIDRISAGARIIKVISDPQSYFSEEKTINIPRNGQIKEHFKLEGKYGSLTVITTPAEVKVCVDQKDCGFSPLTLDKVLAGKRIVEASKEGFYSEKKAVNVEYAKNNTVKIELSNLSPKERKALEAKNRYEAALQDYDKKLSLYEKDHGSYYWSWLTPLILAGATGAGSLVFRNMSYSAHEEYKQETDIKQMDSKYGNADTYKYLSYSGMGVTVCSLITTLYFAATTPEKPKKPVKSSYIGLNIINDNMILSFKGGF